MAQTPRAIEDAADAAAEAVRRMVIEMLLARQGGEVAILISNGHLQPVKRPVELDKMIHVARGEFVRLERA